MIQSIFAIIGLIAILVFIVSLLRKIFVKTTIYEYERGLKYYKGKFQEVLQPGQYWSNSLTTSIEVIDIRPAVLTIASQEVATQDNISVKISLVSSYEVVDPYAATIKVHNYYENLYLTLQLSLRQIVGSIKLDELLEKRTAIGEQLLELSRSKVAELGLQLHSVTVKDLVLPSDLKKAYMQVIKSQKEGLAVLEKARGETAALRNLANAAKMIENNPMLLQLRLLQTVGESSGNTVVMSAPNVPFLVNGKKEKTMTDQNE
ncbi:slipin family protein [Anoxybacteroides tepidamans]|uniref:slipin family protein n=1 Tax=Anoxybacteroides tepidamans TaxID=265948 RepID=UPI0006870CF1|nr:slipin family protein [Anoxybacillus tepidamans]